MDKFQLVVTVEHDEASYETGKVSAALARTLRNLPFSTRPSAGVIPMSNARVVRVEKIEKIKEVEN